MEVRTAVHISTAILRDMTLFSLVADCYCLKEPLFSGGKLEWIVYFNIIHTVRCDLIHFIKTNNLDMQKD